MKSFMTSGTGVFDLLMPWEKEISRRIGKICLKTCDHMLHLSFCSNHFIEVRMYHFKLIEL